MFTRIKDFIHSQQTAYIDTAKAKQYQPLPTLWLLGKTGAGKSSLIKALTGLPHVEIGNGFSPCTSTSQEYDFPQDKPVMRFLDTRGLGEENYDAEADLAHITQHANALVVLMRIDEPEQSAVLSALKQIKKNNTVKHLLLVHSAVLLAQESDRQRQLVYNEQQVSTIWRSKFSAVSVDFETPAHLGYNLDKLTGELCTILPIIDLLINKTSHANTEISVFRQLQKEVLWHCGAASATDLMPGVGLVSVPAIQAKMLHSLAARYQLDFTKQIFAELIGSLGSSFVMQYSTKLGARQLVKFIPVYGQTVGAVAAASMSFATTYGLARVACYYFYHKQKGEQVSQENMQTLYKNAFVKGKWASGYE